MLVRARRALGVPVPAALPRRLAPDAGWRAACRFADLVSPPARGSGSARPSIGRIVARAARADGRASRRELARRVAGRVRTTVTRAGHARDPERLFDPADHESAAYPAGGAAGRAAYLAAISGPAGGR
jgi:hypothetical protein